MRLFLNLLHCSHCSYHDRQNPNDLSSNRVRNNKSIGRQINRHRGDGSMVVLPVIECTARGELPCLVFECPRGIMGQWDRVTTAVLRSNHPYHYPVMVTDDLRRVVAVVYVFQSDCAGAI